MSQNRVLLRGRGNVLLLGSRDAAAVPGRVGGAERQGSAHRQRQLQRQAEGSPAHHKIGLDKDLEDAVAPGHSGIVAQVSDPGAVEVFEAMVKASGIV